MIGRLLCWLGMHAGRFETWWRGPRMLVGHRCCRCGKLGAVFTLRRYML